MFDVPPKCPALANKLTGMFGWRHTYKVSEKHEGINHNYLQKSYSLTLPKQSSSFSSTSDSTKEPDAWVAVHHLQTQSGILDPDDCVGDVADDREQILVSFEDSGPDPGVPQGGGDGASGSSSVGTGSPDIFRDPTNTEAPTTGRQQHKRHGTDVSATHIEVTSTTTCPVTGLGLQVRRSSDPNLLASLKAEGSGNKRWSAAAPHCAGDSPEKQNTNYLSPQWEEDDESMHQQRKNLTVSPQQQQQPFARSGRLSMQFLNDGNGYKWMEAAEKLQQQTHSNSPTYNTSFSTKSLPRESKRKEPLGQAYESIREKDGEMLLIINEKGSPLGLTAIPDNEHGGGLLVQHVEPNGRADRGRLRRGDRILEINGTKLIGLTEGKVQEYLHRALEATELRVRVLRAERKSSNGNVGNNKTRRRDSKVAEMIEAEEKQASTMESKVATVSPTRKSHHLAAAGNNLQMANTRKLGHKIEIALRKGANGLGFSVTTRDNQASRDCPIYIKNILPRGAAIEDGRLKPGDRLLEVDGIPMTGKTQTDVVSILRATQPGATVQLVVSRQQELVEKNEETEPILSTPPKPPPPVLPKSNEKQQQINRVVKSSSARSLFDQHKSQQQQQQQQQVQLNASQHFIDAGSESAASTDSIQAGIAWRSREVLTLHIPVHDTEKAGLGVSVKGKTSSTSLNNTANSLANTSNNSIKHDGDLGIFVKNVIHGGAASRDGRLRMNDQLLSVNGVSLLGQNNAEAMETLRRAMVNQPGKHPGMITLTVARRITRSASSGDIIEQSNDSSNTSDNSGATVIYLTPEKKDLRSMTDGVQNGAANEMHRWSNPVLDRLTGGACSQNSSSRNRISHETNNMPVSMQNAAAHAGLRNDSYYLATHDTWSPSVHTPVNRLQNGHVLIEDDAEPLSPLLSQQMANDSVSTQNSKHSVSGSAPSFDATYSSQLSLETNNSGIEHFSRDALGRRSISEKHHAALDARETGTYQRNKKLREERERERRIQLTKSAFFGSIESLTTRIANANAQIPGYKHGKTASSIEQQQLDLQREARDVVTDLGPSLGLKKSSSLESLQTMVQEIQMSDEPRGAPSALRAPRGRGREDSLRAAVVGEPDINKPRKHWLLEEHTDADAGFTQRNGPFQSSLNDGKNKTRAKKPSILRGIGHMFRFGKNRKETVVTADTTPTTITTTTTMPATISSSASTLSSNSHTKSIPVAALAAMERNTKLLPPAYQPPPPLPPQPKSHNNSNISNNSSNNNGIHQSDVFNQRYQHYANYEDLHPGVQQHNTQAQQQISRRHQHYHSQRSTRSQDVNYSMNSATLFNNNNNNNKQHNNNNNNKAIRPNSSYYEYETVQHNVMSGLNHSRMGSIKHNGHSPMSQQSRHTPSPVTQSRWKSATMNGFSPASLNSSARSRGPYVTHVTIREQQPIYQSVQQTQSHSSKV